MALGRPFEGSLRGAQHPGQEDRRQQHDCEAPVVEFHNGVDGHRNQSDREENGRRNHCGIGKTLMQDLPDQEDDVTRTAEKGDQGEKSCNLREDSGHVETM